MLGVDVPRSGNTFFGGWSPEHAMNEHRTPTERRKGKRQTVVGQGAVVVTKNATGSPKNLLPLTEDDLGISNHVPHPAGSPEAADWSSLDRVGERHSAPPRSRGAFTLETFQRERESHWRRRRRRRVAPFRSLCHQMTVRDGR